MTNEEYDEIYNQFILDKDISHEKLKDLVKRIIVFCQVDQQGQVLFKNPILNKAALKDKILAVLVCRHLASLLQQKSGKSTNLPTDSIIREEVSAEELSSMLREKTTVINARLADLVNTDKKALRIERGSFKVTPYAVEEFIEKLERKNEH